MGSFFFLKFSYDMAPKEEVKFYLLEREKGTLYKGGWKNEIDITNVNSQINTYFNLDIQQSAYFTMIIEGFEYNRFHTQIMSTNGATYNAGRNDFTFATDPVGRVDGWTGDDTVREKWIKDNIRYNNWQTFKERRSEYWLPLKSLQYNQGSIEALSLAAGTFSDLRLPFRKQSPTLSVEMYDHRSDYFEMKLREWHSESVLTEGFVPVLESIKKHVKIMGFSTNGDCNYTTECDCILIDDVTTSRSYAENDLKVISFKLLVVGY
jgi:hypothetical protein